ncbi:thermonuclease family protein [Elioraea sp.]|uniref:thermonuclease family protein n=1 Tax=Elioraea sp. TaxID=2185103 RepID=UPI00307E53DF
MFGVRSLARRLRPFGPRAPFRPRRRTWLIPAIGVAVLAVAAGGASHLLTGGPTWIGPASVIDGDTIEIERQRIRLHGIDAPESDQVCERDGRPWHCGAEAAAALRARIRGHVLTCREIERDRFGRAVARCRAGGQSVNAWMVREGLAVAYLRYSFAYLPEQIEAWWHGRGLWAGRFVHPEDHRHRR